MWSFLSGYSFSTFCTLTYCTFTRIYNIHGHFYMFAWALPTTLPEPLYPASICYPAPVMRMKAKLSPRGVLQAKIHSVMLSQETCSVLDWWMICTQGLFSLIPPKYRTAGPGTDCAMGLMKDLVMVHQWACAARTPLPALQNKIEKISSGNDRQERGVTVLCCASCAWE